MCICMTGGPESYDGPQPDCPIHGDHDVLFLAEVERRAGAKATLIRAAMDEMAPEDPGQHAEECPCGSDELEEKWTVDPKKEDDCNCSMRMSFWLRRILGERT